MERIKYSNYITFQNIATLKFLNRPDVTTADPGLDTVHISKFSKRSKWELDGGELEDNSKIKLKSWRGDLLHSDENGLITATMENSYPLSFKWTLKIENGISIFNNICY